MNALNHESQTESSMTSVRGLQDRSTSASLAINRVGVEKLDLSKMVRKLLPQDAALC